MNNHLQAYYPFIHAIHEDPKVPSLCSALLFSHTTHSTENPYLREIFQASKNLFQKEQELLASPTRMAVFRVEGVVSLKDPSQFETNDRIALLTLNGRAYMLNVVTPMLAVLHNWQKYVKDHIGTALNFAKTMVPVSNITPTRYEFLVAHDLSLIFK